MKIILIKYPDIDKIKYDNCIRESLNGKIYALSWYLDTVCESWQLLSTPDYSFVMPLPIRKKLGFSYIAQPLMIQQLGIFSPFVIDEKIVSAFLIRIPAWCCYLHLNSGNITVGNKNTLRANYVLDIKKDYDSIKSKYHKNTKTQLKKNNQTPLIIEKNIDPILALNFVKDNSIHYTDKVYKISEKVIKSAWREKSLKTWGVKDSCTLELIATASFFFWNRIFYYILPTSSPRGREVQAMRFLLDRFIAEYAGKGFLIDFEGSSIPSVAQFYKNFGAQLQPYPVFEKNNLFKLTRLFNKR